MVATDAAKTPRHSREGGNPTNASYGESELDAPLRKHDEFDECKALRSHIPKLIVDRLSTSKPRVRLVPMADSLFTQSPTKLDRSLFVKGGEIDDAASPVLKLYADVVEFFNQIAQAFERLGIIAANIFHRAVRPAGAGHLTQFFQIADVAVLIDDIADDARHQRQRPIRLFDGEHAPGSAGTKSRAVGGSLVGFHAFLASFRRQSITPNYFRIVESTRREKQCQRFPRARLRCCPICAAVRFDWLADGPGKTDFGRPAGRFARSNRSFRTAKQLSDEVSLPDSE